MFRILLSVMLLALNTPVFAQSTIDVLHYKFYVEVNDQNDTIYGKAEITLACVIATHVVELDFTQANSGKGMLVTHVSGSSIEKTRVFPQKLEINLIKKLNEGDTATFVINYKGIPADGLIISKNKYGNRTFFADNWPNRGHNWLPCHDDPADKASVEFIVTAPQHYQVVANGVQVEETNISKTQKRTHWKEEVPISTKVMVIGIADFAVNLSGTVNNCIPVYSWVYPEDRDKGFFDYAQAAEILPWFIKNVGPYAYKKLANVQSKTTFGGLENANTIFYAESSVSGTRKAESPLAHEIAHQWFGNVATEKSFAHLWLSEGSATYMTILYMESKYGKDTALAMLREDREQVIAFARTNNKPVVNHTKDYLSLLNANSYQKGGWVLHMLRTDLGDSLFWKSVQEYYKRYAGKTADTDDLRRVFEEISGRNLEKFFQQWLFTPGIPKLNISWKYRPEKKTVEVTVDQLQEVEFEYLLKLTLYEPSGEPVATQLRRLRAKKEVFEMPVKTGKTIGRLGVDGDVELLAEIKVER